MAEQNKHTPGADFTKPIWQVEFHHFLAGWQARAARSRPASPAAVGEQTVALLREARDELAKFHLGFVCERCSTVKVIAKLDASINASRPADGGEKT